MDIVHIVPHHSPRRQLQDPIQLFIHMPHWNFVLDKDTSVSLAHIFSILVRCSIPALFQKRCCNGPACTSWCLCIQSLAKLMIHFIDAIIHIDSHKLLLKLKTTDLLWSLRSLLLWVFKVNSKLCSREVQVIYMVSWCGGTSRWLWMVMFAWIATVLLHVMRLEQQADALWCCRRTWQLFVLHSRDGGLVFIAVSLTLWIWQHDISDRRQLACQYLRKCCATASLHKLPRQATIKTK